MSISTNDIRFSKQRYARYDGIAKEVAFEWLKQLGFKDVVENLDESRRKFDKIWDVTGFREELGQWRIEAEVKQDWGTIWHEIPFKYSTIDIPYRKRDKAEEHATHMMVIGGDLKRMFVCKRDVMLTSPVTNKKVRNRGWADEPFYNIDLSCGSFWFKDKKKWRAYTGD